MPTLDHEGKTDMRMKPPRAEMTSAHPLSMRHVPHGKDQNEVAQKIEVTVGKEPDRTKRLRLAPDILDLVRQCEEVVIVHNDCIENLD